MLDHHEQTHVAICKHRLVPVPAHISTKMTEISIVHLTSDVSVQSCQLQVEPLSFAKRQPVAAGS